jgi:hypothetical protein
MEPEMSDNSFREDGAAKIGLVIDPYIESLGRGPVGFGYVTQSQLMAAMRVMRAALIEALGHVDNPEPLAEAPAEGRDETAWSLTPTGVPVATVQEQRLATEAMLRDEALGHVDNPEPAMLRDESPEFGDEPEDDEPVAREAPVPAASVGPAAPLIEREDGQQFVTAPGSEAAPSKVPMEAVPGVVRGEQTVVPLSEAVAPE